VVIPVLNAAGTLPALLEALADQSPSPPDEIVLVDSMSTDDTRRIALAQTNVRIVPLERFSHGRARNLGAREATGAIIVLMTQDALPADRHWLAALLEPLADPRVAAVCSRQVPRPDAPPTEQFFCNTIFRPDCRCGANGLPGARRPLRTCFFQCQRRRAPRDPHALPVRRNAYHE